MSSSRKRRTQLGLEALEDRTVPSFLVGDGATVVLGIPTSGTANTWYQDRYRPAGFSFGQAGGGRGGVVDESISASDKNGSRPAQYNSTFDDFQGLKYDLTDRPTYLAVDLYVPQSWSGLGQTYQGGDPTASGSLASLWAAGVDASGNISNYPHIGFNNQANSGAGGFQVKDRTTGVWTNVPGFTGGDQWYQIGFSINGQGQFDYFVNGQRVYTDATATTATPTAAFSNVMLQGYNAGNSYDIFWDNLRDTNPPVVPGLTGGVGFWQGGNGQALIKSFNGGPGSTALSNWLATTFPNLYGASAGPDNLTGMNNNRVWKYFQQLSPGGWQAQVLATALNVYATTSSLGGNAGVTYGFTVSATGLGARSYNVGMDGAAFGVANNTTLDVNQLLLAVNQKAVNGVAYSGDPAQAQLQQQAADLFNSLNQAGSI
jgi:hypothetical protein